MSNSTDTDKLEQIDGERGIPNVNNDNASYVKRGIIVVVILVVIVLGALAGYLKFRARSTDQVIQTNNMQVARSPSTRTFSTLPPEEEEKKQEIAYIPPVENDIVAEEEDKLTIDKSSAGLMIDGMKPVDSDSVKRVATESKDIGELATLLRSTNTGTRKASHIINRDFLIAKGEYIDCGLQTRIDTTVPGMVSCVVTRHVYSDNGKVLLIERGSTVTGEYRSNMRHGQARIFVLWNRIKTVNGIVIALDSPAADQLGGSGIPGYVDSHFWERFGGAILLSLIDDVARYSTQRADNNGQMNFNSTSDAAQDMASEALKSTINIPPTLYKNHGDRVGIFVARDLDFSPVYGLGIKE